MQTFNFRSTSGSGGGIIYLFLMWTSTTNALHKNNGVDVKLDLFPFITKITKTRVETTMDVIFASAHYYQWSWEMFSLNFPLYARNELKTFKLLFNSINFRTAKLITCLLEFTRDSCPF
jgi:hypothetical protein